MGVTAENAARGAVGSFEGSPVQQLGKLLAEPDKWVRQQKLNELGIVDGKFIDALEKAFAFCKRGILLYQGTGELSVSFNGGKDACVVLYLWLAAAESLRITGELGPDTSEPFRQPVIFFDSSEEFDEVQTFVTWVKGSLDLSMTTVESKSFRKGMEGLVNNGLRAVVMGQRRGDPWMRGVDVFSPSSEGWPAFMRINPIIDWSYSDVWTFLRKFNLPYCALYNDGFTSLGSVTTTFHNPALRRPDGSFAPAYELLDGELERDGRMSRQETSTPITNYNAAEAPTPQPPLAKEPAVRDASSLVGSDFACSAGIVNVGDEILNGKVRDTNAHYLCGMLHSRGVCIKGIATVRDDIHAIAEAVEKMSATCDFVFTSGGLGPTHDDATLAGVARAFKCRLIQDEKFFAMLAKTNSRWSSKACQKMAAIPEGAMVEWPSDGNPWPIVSMHGVYVFAGMPSVFRAMFERAASDGRFTGAQKFACVALQLDAEEGDVLDALQCTVDTFPNVHIGSYPSTDVPASGGYGGSEADRGGGTSQTCRLTITFEAFDVDIIEEARVHLSKALPEGVIINEGATSA